MIIIIGLGNPGEKFKNTRHNVGFMVLDKFAEKNNFPEFKLSKKFNAEISSAFAEASADREGKKILLVKPQTFMNESGKSVRAITKPYTLDPKPLLVVVHDDIDLPIGKIKIVQERGSAGHKGVESIIKSIGNENLIRIRIGIKPEQYRRPVHGTKKAKNLVLKKFSPGEQEILNQTITKTAEVLDFLIKEGLDKAMNEYNK